MNQWTQVKVPSSRLKVVGATPVRDRPSRPTEPHRPASGLCRSATAHGQALIEAGQALSIMRIAALTASP